MSLTSCVRTAVLPVVLLAVAGCGGYGSKVESGNVEVFYKDGVTKEEAERLAAYIVKIMPGVTTRRSFQLRKAGDGYQVRMPVQKQFENDEKVLGSLALDGARYSREVFNGAAVEMVACNDRLETIRTIPPRTDVKYAATAGKVEVLYGAPADKADAERLANFLQPVMAASPAPVVTFKFGRRDAVIEVSMAVNASLLQNPGVLLSLEAIRQNVSKELFGGAATELTLCDEFLQTIQVLK